MEYIVGLTWGDTYVAQVVEAATPQDAARKVAAEHEAPDGAAVTVRRFVPVRTTEKDGTVTIRVVTE